MAKESRTTKADIEKFVLRRKIDLTSIASLTLLYIMAIGFLQFIASFFAKDISLKIPVLVLVYGLVIYILYSVVTGSPAKVARIISDRRILLVSIGLLIMLILTAYTGGELIPGLFSIK